jgi:hypothetical protein
VNQHFYGVTGEQFLELVKTMSTCFGDTRIVVSLLINLHHLGFHHAIVIT